DYKEEKQVKLTSFGGQIAGKADITVLTADDPHAHSSFENPKAVQPTAHSAVISAGDIITLPKASVVSVVVKK
ncbi:MAG: hypothetical protein FWD71_21080, partial [Oscillospiraceae bacterium]|nr:hypothetical protein [Oscillospiraceae bacterium]